MAFTNQWDTTTPSDFELANLYAGNLRQWRLDVQERMGAMSGLDANKPSFQSDAQPANWNGVLYFATDTGLIYQFQNPNWINVSVFGGPRVFKDQSFKSTIGTTAVWVYTVSIPAIFNVTSRVRLTLFYNSLANTTGGTVDMVIGPVGTATSQVMGNFGLPQGNFNRHIIMEGGNYGALNNQYWFWNDVGNVVIQAPGAVNTTIDTSGGAVFAVGWQGADVNDFGSFYGIGIEIF